MGKVKSKLGEDYQLSIFEFKFVKDLNSALISSIYRERLVSTLLTYIAKTRFNIEPSDGKTLQFQVDLNQEDDRTLKISQVD